MYRFFFQIMIFEENIYAFDESAYPITSQLQSFTLSTPDGREIEIHNLQDPIQIKFDVINIPEPTTIMLENSDSESIYYYPIEVNQTWNKMLIVATPLDGVAGLWYGFDLHHNISPTEMDLLGPQNDWKIWLNAAQYIRDFSASDESISVYLGLSPKG